MRRSSRCWPACSAVPLPAPLAPRRGAAPAAAAAALGGPSGCPSSSAAAGRRRVAGASGSGRRQRTGMLPPRPTGVWHAMYQCAWLPCWLAAVQGGPQICSPLPGALRLGLVPPLPLLCRQVNTLAASWESLRQGTATFAEVRQAASGGFSGAAAAGQQRRRRLVRAGALGGSGGGSASAGGSPGEVVDLLGDSPAAAADERRAWEALEAVAGGGAQQRRHSGGSRCGVGPGVACHCAGQARRLLRATRPAGMGCCSPPLPASAPASTM